MEAFLSETFMKLVFNEAKYFRSFVKTHPKFEEKFELKQIFEKQDQLNAKVTKVILDTIYHNLPIVRNMYRDTFDIKFPETENLHEHVKMRHDLVHRNGKTKDGQEIIVNDNQIDKLIEDTKAFIQSLCLELKLV